MSVINSEDSKCCICNCQTSTEENICDNCKREISEECKDERQFLLFEIVSLLSCILGIIISFI